MKFNPVNLLIGLIVGWFVASLLQAAGYAVIFGGYSIGAFIRIMNNKSK